MSRAPLITIIVVAACGSGGHGPMTIDATPSHWQPRTAIAGGGRLEGAVVALDDKVFVMGGWDQGVQVVTRVEVYDPATDRWDQAAPLPRALHHLNVAVVNGKLYMVGALEGDMFTQVGDVYEFDPAANTWTTKTAMPAGTERGASAVAADPASNVIYVAGGSQADAVDTFSAYHVDTDTWESLPPMPAPDYHAVGAFIGGTFYAIGGFTFGLVAGTSHTVTDVLAYDPIAKAWSPRAAMPTARGGCATGIINGKILCAGGEASSMINGVATTTESYDPVADMWSTLEPMRTPRAGTNGAVVNGVLYVPGGALKIVYEPVDVNEAFTP
jgi:N-acetylneuraminic acid mutarotase